MATVIDPLDGDFVVIGKWGLHVYYFIVRDHYPESDLAMAIKDRIIQKMASTIGQRPQVWAIVRASEFDPDQAAIEAKRDPILVV